MEKTVIALLSDAFHIKCYRTGKEHYVFVDQDMAADHVGMRAMPWTRNVWRFTPAEFRSHVEAAARKGLVVHNG